MEILYDNKKLEKSCKDIKNAKRLYNLQVAEKLHSVINYLENSVTLIDVRNMPSYHLHSLEGNRKGTWAIDLGRRLGYRLIIKPLDENKKEWTIKDENQICKSTNIILVLEVTNHYE